MATPQARLPDAPDLDLLDAARRLSLKSDVLISPVVGGGLATEEPGYQRTFWVIDVDFLEVFQVKAVLQHVSLHAYWYMGDGVTVSDHDLLSTATAFEQRIYPTVTSAFGGLWPTDGGGDQRITILSARIPGVAGYYTAADEYPTQVRRFSNQRKMVYMSTVAFPMGSDGYLSTLAHEIQHVIHGNIDPTEETWVNEGLSELAAEIAGYPSILVFSFLQSPTISLVHWPKRPEPTIAYYGAGYLFMSYLAEHYARDGTLLELVRRPEDGISGLDAYLRAAGFSITFRDVFADWVVANLLDEEEGSYAYPSKDVWVATGDRLWGFGSIRRSVPQYAADYVELLPPPGDVLLSFRGQRETPLLPVEPPGGGSCWWGNRGDRIDATLTGHFHLSDQRRLTLELTLWYDIEELWDYVYVEVSTDGGKTWDILEGVRTSLANPVGNSFGPGYTGQSVEWVQDTIDLTPYAGREVFLRFESINDESINGTGVCIAEITIPQMGWSDAGEAPSGFVWDARGFARIQNRVSQEYIVQVVEYTTVGPRVRRMSLDALNHGEMAIRGVGDEVERVVVVVATLAEKTSQHAAYSMEVQRAP